ncbi:MAG: hypothetical protein ACPG5T_00240, partial [Endozoicomonas sp.]
NLIKALVTISLIIMFNTGCASYQKKALIHSVEFIKIPQPVKKVVFSMPNGKTHMMMTAKTSDNQAFSIVKVKDIDSSDFNFDQPGGFLDPRFKGEQSIDVDGTVLCYKKVYYDGVLYEKFRKLSSTSLVPVNE